MTLQTVDPIAWLKASRERFFPGGKFDVTRLLAYVMADVLELGRGECRIVRRDSWWFVVSDSDWLAHDAISVSELFQRVVPAPAHGEHSMRAEVLLTAYADDVYTAMDTEELVIKGEAPDRKLIEPFLTQEHRVVGFRVT